MIIAMIEGKDRFNAAHGEFNGDTEACLGKACPSSCCKNVRLDDNGQEWVSYFFPDEFEGFQERLPDYEELGIDFKEIRLRQSEVYMGINNCLGEDGCKLGDDRPLICKTFPWTLVRKGGAVAYNCPTWREIGQDDEFVEALMRAREALGLTDNKQWEEDRKKNVDDPEAGNQNPFASAFGMPYM